MSEFDKILPMLTVGIAENNRDHIAKKIKAIEKKMHELNCELSDRLIELSRYEEYLDNNK